MTLSKHTLQIFTDYVTGKTDKLDGVYREFFDYAITDVNSSKLREELTMHVSGYDPIPGKLGYDGIDTPTGKFKEAKPKLHTRDKSHSGNGNFSDATLATLQRMLVDDIDVIVSYFAHGKLVYIMEFPFTEIYDRLHEQVYEKCVIQGQTACRSANFNYSDYMDSPRLNVKFINWDIIDKYPKIINKPFLNKLRLKRQYDNTITKLFEREELNTESV
jgi:hypothetical protein